jgi:predicted RNA binding protein YcfA (HicA-like mRNA interferase family)
MLPKGLSGQQVQRALLKADFVVRRQKGSHILMYNEKQSLRVVVPDHKQIKTGTLRAIIRQAGLAVSDFIALLEQ